MHTMPNTRPTNVLVSQVEFDCDGPLTYVKRVSPDEAASLTAHGEWFEITLEDYRKFERRLDVYMTKLDEGADANWASFKGYIEL